MGQKLTDGFAKSATATADGKPYAIYYDTEVKGFGLRITKGGARSFILNYRARGVERRLTIGSFPDWKVSAAREEARRLKRLVDQGRDPMGERHDERAAPTMSDLVDRYLREHAPRKREGSRREDERLIAQWIRPELGSRKLAEVRHADIERGAPQDHGSWHTHARQSHRCAAVEDVLPGDSLGDAGRQSGAGA